jgi:hypothetical protein
MCPFLQKRFPYRLLRREKYQMAAATMIASTMSHQ